MEQRNNLVLQGTETFSRGQLDNVALESGSIVLDSAAGRYLQYGSYTTPEFAMPPFCNLNVSWNAFAPHNTMVEVRCRVYAGSRWTGWMRKRLLTMYARGSAPSAALHRVSMRNSRCLACPSP